jgi:hypothetical protein
MPPVAPSRPGRPQVHEERDRRQAALPGVGVSLTHYEATFARSFYAKPSVRRANRRISIHIVRFWGSTWDVEVRGSSGTGVPNVSALGESP